MKKTRLLYPIILILILAGPRMVSGQHSPKYHWLYDYGYGVSGGFTISDFPTDSVGFTRNAMPYGGLFLNLDFHPKAGINISALYTVKGINRSTPYERYRYSYLSSEVTARFRPVDFLMFEAGYRYGSELSARKVLLNGNQPSGTEKKDIAGFGDYGQGVIGVVLQFNPTTQVNFRYGLMDRNRRMAMTHWQFGVSIDIQNRVESKVRQYQKDNEPTQETVWQQVTFRNNPSTL